MILIPGPSVLFVVSRGLALGRRAALATVAGNGCGFALQLDRSCRSGSARSSRARTRCSWRCKLLGAAYLVLLGVRKIRDRKALAGLLGVGELAPRRLRTTIREGFVVGATNPKGLIIFTAILPQFIDRASGHTTLQLLVGRRLRRGPRLDLLEALLPVVVAALGVADERARRRSPTARRR